MYRIKTRKTHKIPFLFAVLVLSLSFFASCSNGQEVNPSSAAKSSEQAASEISKAPPNSQEAAPADEIRELTDMSGRTMQVPANIDKVFSTDPVSAIYLYTMDPDRMLGWNYDLNDLEKEIILPKYHDLPSFGMGDSVNYEAVIAADPQIALNVSAGDDAAKAEADKLADSLGVPVVIVSNKLDDSAEVYRFLGELFGDPARGEELAAYVNKTFEDVSDAEIPENQKATIYYGNGENSLETAPRGSTHAQIIDFVNAVNVADLEVEGGSRIQISTEQLLAWDPDYIIVNGEPKQDISGGAAAQAVIDNPEFATLKAVQNNNVIGVPNTPFSWVDRPPGPNRVIGIRWLAKRIYPEAFGYEIDAEVKEFYKLFYHLELNEDQLNDLMYR